MLYIRVETGDAIAFAMPDHADNSQEPAVTQNPDGARQEMLA